MERRQVSLAWILLAAIALQAQLVLADEPQDPAAGATPAAGDVKTDADKKPSDDDYELYQVFADTLDQVERNYVKPVSRRELMEAAIHGVLSKLDPYSNYISPDDIGRFKTSVENQFGGIGIQIDIEDGQLKIVSPLFGTPAYKAGLESGDTILEIDGKSAEGIHRDEAVKRLKGEPNSKVTLLIRHADASEPKIVTITREWIHVDTVLGDRRKVDDTWDYMLDRDKHIGYIRITAFSRDTAQDLKKALASLQSEGLKGLIVDLRFNPGGLLTSAIEVSDLFVANGKIVSTEGRNTPARSWDAQQEGTFEGFPMAVLVNHYSASASEIFSACLQDHKRAVIVGERTWGKGSVQNVVELEGGKSALKLTTASYHRPSGKNIHRFPNAKDTDEWGVSPDSGFDLRLNTMQTKRLIDYRHDRDILVGKHAKAAAIAKEQAPADAPKGDAAKAASQAKSDAKPEPAKPEPAPSDATKAEAPKAKEPEGPFVDLQLQKAVDYLTNEMARAE